MHLLIFAETPTMESLRCRWPGLTLRMLHSSSSTSVLRWIKVLLGRKWDLTLFSFGPRPFLVLNNMLPQIKKQWWNAEKSCFGFMRITTLIFKNQGFLIIQMNLTVCWLLLIYSGFYSHPLAQSLRNDAVVLHYVYIPDIHFLSCDINYIISVCIK